MASTEPGRRERKKAQTKRAIADAAMELFVARGFDAVTVSDVAERADVSVSTLFKHFPSKAALVFGDWDEVEAAMVRAITDRSAGVSILRALRDVMIQGRHGRPAGPGRELVALIESTPALQTFVDQLWVAWAGAVARAIADEIGRPHDDPEVRALARYVVLVPSVARHDPNPAGAIESIFARLESGWGSMLAAPSER